MDWFRIREIQMQDREAPRWNLNGKTTADVARVTLDAVLQRRFYVLPHRQAAVAAEHRLRRTPRPHQTPTTGVES